MEPAGLRTSPCSAKPITGHFLACPMAEVEAPGRAKLFFPAFEQFCRLAFYLWAQALALPTFFEDGLGVGIAPAGQHLGDTLLGVGGLMAGPLHFAHAGGLCDAFDVERMRRLFHRFFLSQSSAKLRVVCRSAV